MRGLVTVRGEGCGRQIDRAWPKVPCSVPWEVGGGEASRRRPAAECGGPSASAPQPVPCPHPARTNLSELIVASL